MTLEVSLIIMELLEEIKLRLASNNPEERIDALLDAWEHHTAGIDLVIKALSDSVREVRQSAWLLLLESEAEIAKQALWNYLPFAQMRCLHTISEFKFDSFDQEYHPNYFAIADYNNSLVCYWDIGYKLSGVAIWNLRTGNQERDYSLTAHDFRLSKQGKIFVHNYQDIIMPAQELETQEYINEDFPHVAVMRGIDPLGFTVSKTNKPLVAIGEFRTVTKFELGARIETQIGKLKIWNYEKYSCLFRYEFEDLILYRSELQFGNLKANSEKFYIYPLLFTPDGNFLIARFVDRQKHCLIRIWDTETNKLVQTLDNLPKLTITSVGVRPDGTIIACGIREEKVCAWELQSDRLIYTFSEMSPCILSTDGRVLIYTTTDHEIVMRDLVAEKDLCRLQGHNAAIAYLALSSDREFVTSYSIDRQIKIWGIPNHS